MPDWTKEIRSHLAGLRLSAPDEANVTEELQQHLDDRYNDLRSRGTDDVEARRSALEELGESELLRRRLRGAMRRPPASVPLGAGEGRGLAGLWRDLRFGVRMLRRSPGFTVTAALTIALGIGANTTIFSLVNALLLRPLAGTVRGSELVMIGRTQAGQGFDTFSYPDYLDYRAGTRTLSAIAATFVAPAHLSTGGASQRVRIELVSGNYFGTLGTRAALGRLLVPAADRGPGGSPIAVLSATLWESRFGSDPGVIGQSVRINGAPYTVVGVAERGFNGERTLGVVDLFVPMTVATTLLPNGGEMLDRRGGVWIDLFGRLAPNATVTTAQAELGAMADELARRFPDTNRERGVRVSPGIGFDPFTRVSVTQFMTVLLAVVALVLLIASANVANLLLARGSVRARELAVRASLGASRARLVRQLLAEALLLAGLGGVAGVLLGAWAVRLVVRLPVFSNQFGGVTPTLDPRVLGFAIGAMVLSGLAFALPPAFRTSRVDLVTSLKLGTAGSGDARSPLRTGLVVAQLALSLVILAAAGLFVRTLQALYRIEPGFETRHVLVATVDVGLQGYDEPRARRLLAELEQRVQALPGVQHAALGYMLPLGGGGGDTRIFPAEAVTSPDDPGLKTDVNTVTPTYFETLGMPVVAGRGFTAADRDGAPPVAIINEAVAQALWPGLNPIGRRFRIGHTEDVLEVVGLVRTARYRSLVEAPRPFYYRPFAQAYRPSMTLHVRTASDDPYTVLQSVRRALDELDRDLPLSRVRTLAQRLDGSLGSQRTAAVLVSVYGALALVLAVIGLYGSMAYAVSRRTREMGVRMALGARPSEVRRQVLWQALRVALVGTIIGLVAAIPASRLVRTQLYGVEPTDPATLVAVIVLLIAASLAAAYVPARRATKVDPVTALRTD